MVIVGASLLNNSVVLPSLLLLIAVILNFGGVDILGVFVTFANQPLSKYLVFGATPSVTVFERIGRPAFSLFTRTKRSISLPVVWPDIFHMLAAATLAFWTA